MAGVPLHPTAEDETGPNYRIAAALDGQFHDLHRAIPADWWGTWKQYYIPFN